MTTRDSLFICFLIAAPVLLLCFINSHLSQSDLIKNVPEQYAWLSQGLLNIMGYMTLLLPGFLIYRYVQKVNYLESDGDNLLLRTIRSCFGDEKPVSSLAGSTSTHQRTFREEAILLCFHFCGLQISYLTWGILQEKVMTQKYESESFKDSQFLVFVNRVLAFSMSGLYLWRQKSPRYRCPLYKYAFCSLSNIMSSWCQYEALKYVSFPHQVLAKAAKTIPVMLMGTIVSRTKYQYHEYVTSVILSAGMLLFMLNAGNDRSTSVITTLSGAVLLVFYIVCDSFTSNWQGALFKTYNVRPVQMMCFVNLFSCIFTLASLSQQGSFFNSMEFMARHPQFIVDCVVLSVCSATGQLFIFSTIAKFGPLVFAIITTVRQGFSILLSCLFYHHHINSAAGFGLVLVFASIILRIYCGYRTKRTSHASSKGKRVSV